MSFPGKKNFKVVLSSIFWSSSSFYWIGFIALQARCDDKNYGTGKVYFLQGLFSLHEILIFIPNLMLTLSTVFNASVFHTTKPKMGFTLGWEPTYAHLSLPVRRSFTSRDTVNIRQFQFIWWVSWIFTHVSQIWS